MKIFEGEKSSYHGKVNFVDGNDVFIGYDMAQDCCEHADWYIADSVVEYNYDSDKESGDSPCVDLYEFDADYFKEFNGGDLDEGGMVVFKLVSDGLPDLYLHLFNCHNGYYGHGFEVKHSGEIVLEGCL